MVEAKLQKIGLFSPDQAEAYVFLNEEYGRLRTFNGGKGFANLPAVRRDAESLSQGCKELGITEDNVTI